MSTYEVKEYEVLAETREHNGHRTTITHLLLSELGWTDTETIKYLIGTNRARVYYVHQGLKRVYVAPAQEDGRETLKTDDPTLNLHDFRVPS